MAADYSTGAAIFLFFLLTLLLNPLAHLLTGSRLHSGELATIYIMMIVASAIPSWGFVMNLIPFLGGLFYFATPENDWANIIHPHIKPWLVSQDRAAIWKLFEGAARGEPVPWGLWHKPMLAWGFFILRFTWSRSACWSSCASSGWNTSGCSSRSRSYRSNWPRGSRAVCCRRCCATI